MRVLNLEDRTAVLPSGLELADACPLQPFHLQPEPQSCRVSELTHLPAGKLTAPEQRERRRFVEEKLPTFTHPSAQNPRLRERVIQLLLLLLSPWAMWTMEPPTSCNATSC